jgi:hypothetical protein
MREFVLVVLGVWTIAVACGSGAPGATHVAKLTIPCTNDATKQAAIDTNVRNETAIPIRTQLAQFGSVTPVPFLLPDDETTCKIRKVLLTPDDLKPRWRLSDFFHSDYGSDRIYPDRSGTCGVPYTYLVAGLHVEFEKGTSATATMQATEQSVQKRPIPEYLSEALLVFADGAAASDVMSAVRRSCHFAPATTSEGDSTPVASSSTQFHVISLPSIGDDTIAFRFAELSADQFEVLIRRGDSVEDISLGGSGANASELEEIAKIADAKIADQGSYLQGTEPAVAPTPTLDPGSRQGILQSALLTPDELPRGWIPGRGSELDLRSLHFCTDAPVLPRRVRGASGSYSGSAPGSGGALGIGVLSYESQDADAIMRAVIDGSAFPDGCSGSVQNIAVDWSVTPLTLPPLGDSAASWRAIARHTSDAGAPDLPLISDIELDFEVFRRGNLIALVIESRDAPRSGESSFLDKLVPSELATFSAAVDAKLRAIEGKLPPG